MKQPLIWVLEVLFICYFAPRADGAATVSLIDSIETDVCQIAASPENFDGTLIRIEAYISYEFEDSTLHDPSCREEALVNERESRDTEPHIWLEFADHASDSHVKGFAPLVNDEQLKRLRATIIERGRMHQMTRATMIGTFYAGKPIRIAGRNTSMRGFGHMGCCSLFVLSRVESVTLDYSRELNYSWADWNIGLPQGCYSEQMLSVPNNATLRQWQEAVNEGNGDLHLDAGRAAQEELKKIKSGEDGRVGGTTELLNPEESDLNPPPDQRPTETLLESSPTEFLKRYEFIEADRTTRFVIVVARPYWLESLAGSPGKVVWAPVGASVIHCASVKHRKP